MKNIVAAAWLVLVAHTVWGQQNRLPQDEARHYAKPCAEQAATLDDLPLQMDVDPDKPCAERGEGGGAMVLPAKKLEATFPKVGQEVMPVGQLWLRKWTLVVDGKPVPTDKLRIVTVNVDGQDHPMALFLLGVRQKGAHDLELVVYGKEREPLATMPLQKLDLVPPLPLELEWKRGDKDADTLTLNLVGKHQTVLKLGRQEKEQGESNG